MPARRTLTGMPEVARRQRSNPVAPAGLWERSDMRQALADRDLGAVITIFRRWTGASQTDVGVLLGLSQPHVSDFERGIRRATSMAMFERFADGLGIPRPLLGLGAPSPQIPEPEAEQAQQGLAKQAPSISAVEFVEWIAEHGRASFREVYDRLAARVQRLQHNPEPERRHRAYLRDRVTRQQLVTALASYYPAPLAEDCSFYRVQVDGEPLSTTVLTRPSWVRTQIRLGTEAERFEYVSPTAAPVPTPRLGDKAITAAIDRLAEAELSATVLTNDPVYRLLRVTVERERLEAAVALMPFADYALTMDLLEAELVDALAERNAMGLAASEGRRRLSLPLRDTYLPSVLHALDVERRACAGGPVALLAAARPAGPGGRRPPDYALLVQERSPRVLNAVGKLAVIPKAFHQPTVEPAAEASLSTTLQRELEEELLGRAELGSLFGEDFRKVDPLHAGLLSPPLRWLLDHQDSGGYRTECVGFGINLLSGNYEFACLVLIDDEEWWARFGSQVEANWEVERIRLYSSRDTAGLRDLMLDPRWSNEGLFALNQGLRRLAELDRTQRVATPRIELETSDG
jgi:transcriptional regulator with XRE-family HTH domain